MDKFYNEIEHYMRIPMLASKAKQELNIIVMQPAETVNEYYYQIFKLWQQANTPDDQRIEKFKLTLKSAILISLLAAKHNSLKKLLDAAQLVKKQRKKISSNFLAGNQTSQQVQVQVQLQHQTRYSSYREIQQPHQPHQPRPQKTPIQQIKIDRKTLQILTLGSYQ